MIRERAPGASGDMIVLRAQSSWVAPNKRFENIETDGRPQLDSIGKVAPFGLTWLVRRRKRKLHPARAPPLSDDKFFPANLRVAPLLSVALSALFRLRSIWLTTPIGAEEYSQKCE